ncbi:hypothetical protein FRC17_001784 [Serendipita sp. 399]|nr:hypothetical protein FRC17_001784 [Serendipita sp. 399]
MSENYSMSEKAKGKRRAYPILVPTSGQLEDHSKQTTIPIVIRFADNSSDLSLELPPDMTIDGVADVIRRSRPHLKEKQIKLIHAGKLLFEYTHLSSLRPPASSQPQEALSRPSTSERVTHGKAMRRQSFQEPSPLWLHCSASDPKSDDSDTDADQLTDQPSPYDRFTDAGLPRQDVETVRGAFRRLLYGNARNGNEANGAGYNPTPTQINQLEANWVETINQPSTYEEVPAPSPSDSLLSRVLPSTTYSSFIRNFTQGVILGFFFPFMPATVFKLMERLPAFYDGDVWIGLNQSLNRVVSSLDATPSRSAEDAVPQGPETEEEEREGARSTSGARDQPERLATPLDRIWPADTIMDPVPGHPFSLGMLQAVLMGMVLNIVIGFYLWSYTP